MSSRSDSRTIALTLAGAAVAIGAFEVLKSLVLPAGWLSAVLSAVAVALVTAFAARVASQRMRELAAAAAAGAKARERAAQRLRAVERFTDALMEHSSDLITVLNTDGTIRFASPSHERILGYTPRELVGRNAFELVHPDDRPGLLETFAAGINTPGLTVSSEFRFRHKDGSWRVVDAAARAALGDPVIAGAVINSRDVTESRRVERDKAALLAVAHDVAGALELDEVLTRVQQRTAEVLPCDGVATLYWDAARESYRLVSHVGLPESLVAAAHGLSIPRGSGLGGRVSDGLSVLANDLGERRESVVPLLAAHGITAFAAVPLAVRGRNIGTLVAVKVGAGRFHPPQIPLLESIGRQLAVAIETADLYAAQRDEAEVAAALARCGRELIAHLDRPVLLDRLCRLSTEVLGCEVSRTLLLDPDDNAFATVASSGDPAERWEAIRAVRVPRALAEQRLGAFAADDVVEVDLRHLAAPVDAPLVASDADAPRALVMALRRGGELVGVHTARYRSPGPCTPTQRRIAAGLAQLASLALENARLVEELDRADRIKSDFVASMSHELRTPLNVIIGYADLLADHMFGELSDEQAETVQRIGEQGRELLELVNTTLDLSRLESGRVAVALQDVDLVHLLAEIEVEVQLVRKNPAVALTWRVDAALPRLWTDPIKLKVIVKNLLLNALKFTDAGEVIVRARLRGGGVEIAVDDSGIGIAPELLPLIFEPFRQGDHGGVAGRGGVGLGLHIVRRLLDMLGGTIEVESELHRGSSFRMWVPLRVALGEGRPPSVEAAARDSSA